MTLIAQYKDLFTLFTNGYYKAKTQLGYPLREAKFKVTQSKEFEGQGGLIFMGDGGVIIAMIGDHSEAISEMNFLFSSIRFFQLSSEEHFTIEEKRIWINDDLQIRIMSDLASRKRLEEFAGLLEALRNRQIGQAEINQNLLALTRVSMWRPQVIIFLGSLFIAAIILIFFG